MVFEGVVKKVLPIKEGVSEKSGKSWKSQEFVVDEVGNRYNQSAVFSLFGDAVDTFAPKEGQRVSVEFDMSANEYKDRYFGKNNAYNVTDLDKAPEKPKEAKATATKANAKEDDLPF